MGREARCMGALGDWVGEGKLLLETDDLIFRGAQRLKVPLREITEAAAEAGWLVVTHPGGRARFDLGTAAPKWADAIRNPKSLVDKLGIRPTSRVAVVGVDDADFLGKLRARAPDVTQADEPLALEGEPFDFIVYGAAVPAALEALAALRDRIVQNGGIWVVSPKRRPEIADAVVIDAGRKSGLVDVKVARFSDSHTALKLVIPKTARG
jgi:hypothetical protein